MAETLFMRSPDGRLRDLFTTETLEKELQRLDSRAEVWLPWKDGDRRGFGFVTFQDAAKAKEFLECSPRTILDVSIEFHKKTARPRVQPTDGLFTELSTAVGDISWATYHATPQLKQALQSVVNTMDPAYVKRTAEVRAALRGTPELRPGLGVALFSGPPGVGKTLAMRLIASEARARAWVVSASRLVDDFEACKKATAFIQNMDGMCMIDEAEVLFPPRSSLLHYQSVMAKTHHKVLTHFLEVVDGLLSKPHHPGRMLVLATNLPLSMDAAFRSRIRVEVAFPLPVVEQCRAFWRDNARHLNPVDRFTLALASNLSRLSFRDMDHLAEQLVQRSAGGSSANLPDYLRAILVEVRWPPAVEVVKGALNVLYATGNAIYVTRVLGELGGVARLFQRARL